MIKHLEKTYEVYSQDGKDEYGQLGGRTLVGQAVVSISLLNHSVLPDNPAYTTSSHLGLTQDKTIERGHLLVLNGEEYNVEFTTPETPICQLFLRKL